MKLNNEKACTISNKIIYYTQFWSWLFLYNIFMFSNNLSTMVISVSQAYIVVLRVSDKIIYALHGPLEVSRLNCGLDKRDCTVLTKRSRCGRYSNLRKGPCWYYYCSAPQRCNGFIIVQSHSSVICTFFPPCPHVMLKSIIQCRPCHPGYVTHDGAKTCIYSFN